MGTKGKPGDFDCYEKAEDDEPMFVLLARDPVAADLVRIWVAMRAAHADGSYHPERNEEEVRQLLEDVGAAFPEDRQLREAMACADAMERWRKENR